jgi:LPXTG-motif cell wall-anchored protein
MLAHGTITQFPLAIAAAATAKPSPGVVVLGLLILAGALYFAYRRVTRGHF